MPRPTAPRPRPRLLATAALVLLLAGCQNVPLAVSPALQSGTEVLEVEGRQGWQFNQVIRFGGYRTTPVRRGWGERHSSSYSIDLVVRFERSFLSARNKLSFTLEGPGGRSAHVEAAGQLSYDETVLAKGWFALGSIENEVDTYTGVIQPADPAQAPWRFFLQHPDSGRGADGDTGFADDGQGHRLRIRALHQFAGQKALPPGLVARADLPNFGFEFLQDDEPVAAVQAVNNGRVWLREDLGPDQRLLIASLATALMLRQSLAN